MVARQKTTLRKAIESAVVLIFLVSMYLLILVPFVLYTIMRGLTDGDYLNDWKNHVFDFVDCIIIKFKKKRNLYQKKD